MFAINEPLALWIQISAIAAWLGLVFLAAYTVKRLSNDSELVRKVVHIGTGHILLLAWWLKLPLGLCLAVSIIFSGVALLSYFRPILPVLEDVGRKTYGVFYYAVSITCLVTWFWRIGLPQYAVVGVLVMAWGDGIAAIVGQRWGKHIYHFMGSKKTLEGSLAMLLASYIVTFLVLVLAGEVTLSTWLIPLPVAIAATTLEALSPQGTDNLSVPLASAALCYGLNLGL